MHPLGARPPDRPRALDADRVHAGGDEVAARAGHLADVEAVVGRERLRSAEEASPAGVGEDRHARRRGLEHGHQLLLDVSRELVEAEVGRDAPLPPGPSLLLERADQEPARVLLDVDALVVVPEHGQVRIDPLELLGHGVVVLAGVQRHVQTGAPRELPRPHAAGVDDEVGGDLVARAPGALALVDRDDAPDPTVPDGHVLDPHPLETGRAARPGALDEGGRDLGRIRLAVGRHERAADEPGDVDRGEQRRDLLGRDEVHARDAERVVHGLGAPELLPTVGRVRDREAADLAKARALSGLGLELVEQPARVADEPRVALARAHRADQARGVPGRAAGEPPALEQQHVLPAELREVPGDRGARDAAADDDGAGAGGQRGGGHRRGSCASAEGRNDRTGQA